MNAPALQMKWLASATLTALFLTLLLALVGCAPEPTGADAGSAETGQSDDSDSASEDDSESSEPRQQEKTCDWESGPASGSGEAPTGQEGDLQTVIIGSWQHTHIDTGAGYEQNSADIRYVFPSTDHLLYCQDVPGITDQAENSTDFTWEGNTIAIPGAPGFTVSEWNDDSMVWINNLDDSLYLLQRR